MQGKVMLQRIEKNNNNYTVSNITPNPDGSINAVPCP